MPVTLYQLVYLVPVGWFSDIFLYDENSAREYQISFSPNEQTIPALADGTVLWLEKETGGSTVTMQSLSGVLPQPTPTLPSGNS